MPTKQITPPKSTPQTFSELLTYASCLYCYIEIITSDLTLCLTGCSITFVIKLLVSGCRTLVFALQLRNMSAIVDTCLCWAARHLSRHTNTKLIEVGKSWYWCEMNCWHVSVLSCSPSESTHQHKPDWSWQELVLVWNEIWKLCVYKSGWLVFRCTFMLLLELSDIKLQRIYNNCWF